MYEVVELWIKYELPKGCQEGKNCRKFHPRMCRESLTKRTCSKIGDASRCSQGYHVRSITFKVPKNNTHIDPWEQRTNTSWNGQKTRNQTSVSTDETMNLHNPWIGGRREHSPYEIPLVGGNPFPKELLRLQIVEIIKELVQAGAFYYSRDVCGGN